MDAYYEPTAAKRVLDTSIEIGLDKTFLQIGGCGLAAISWLLLGGKSSTLITPSPSKRDFCLALANEFNVQSKLKLQVSFGKSLLLGDCQFDIVFIQGSLHHMQYEKALTEILRVLRKGGIFLAIEVLEAPGYKTATKLLGKREKEVKCEILDRFELYVLKKHFPDLDITFYRAFIRYFMLGFSKITRGFFGDVWPAKVIFFWDRRVKDVVQEKFGSYVLLVLKK